MTDHRPAKHAAYTLTLHITALLTAHGLF